MALLHIHHQAGARRQGFYEYRRAKKRLDEHIAGQAAEPKAEE
jgi:hypothetical protein